MALEKMYGPVDYLRMFWRRRVLIIVGVLICTAGSLIISLMLPSVYGITLMFQMGEIWGNPIESPYALKAMIDDNESFIKTLVQNNNLSPRDIPFIKKIKFHKLAVPEHPGHLPSIIFITVKGEDRNKTKETTSKIAQYIVNRYQEACDEALKSYKEYEESMALCVSLLKEDIHEKQKRLDNLSGKAKEDLWLDIDRQKDRTRKMREGLAVIKLNNSPANTFPAKLMSEITEARLLNSLPLVVITSAAIALLFMLFLAFSLELKG